MAEIYQNSRVIHADDLNSIAEEDLRNNGYDPTDPENSVAIVATCQWAAESQGFELVAESEQCEVYARRRDEARVNLWIADIEGKGLAPGGLGFDDQYEWADED